MIVKLGDVATYINGFAFKPSDWSDTRSCGLPIIRIQDLTGNSYQTNYYNGKYDPKYEVLNGDVLISWSASLGVYVWEGEKAVLNQHIFKVLFDKMQVDKDFFVYQLQRLLEKASSKAHGATMKHLTKPTFDAFPFYLPSLEEQKYITSFLNNVSDLISLRKQQLAKLDELVKTRFVEMFGEPTNNKNFPTMKMTEICDIIDGDRGKNYPKQEDFAETGHCLFLNAKNVTSSGFSFESQLFVSEEKDHALHNGKLKRGDIVLTTRGTLGNLAYYDESVPFEHIRINSGMVILRIKKDMMSEKFFIEQFKLQLQTIKDKIASGTAQPQLPISTMNKIQMLIPPLSLQMQFSAFVTQVEKTKFSVQKALAKAQLLFDSLMQKYFG